MKEEKKMKISFSKTQIAIMIALVMVVVFCILTLFLKMKFDELNSVNERMIYLEQRNQELEKENKEMHDLVVYNISEGIPLKKKIAFLTFDDGPSENTLALLDALKKADLKANFFLLGHKIDQFPEVTQKIGKDGHGVFIHSDTHQYKEIYSSPAAFKVDVESTRKKIEGVGIEQPRLYRFPGGSNNGYLKDEFFPEIKKILSENQLTYVDWNVDSGDAKSQNVPASKIAQNIIEQCQNKSIATILMHDTLLKQTTIDAIPEIAKGLKDLGFQVMVIPAGVNGPRFK